MAIDGFGDKKGRPRRYDFAAAESYPDPFTGYALSVLHELLERVIDQIEDLPAAAFDFTSPGSWFCLGWLPLHLAVSEYHQIARLARILEITEPQLTDRLQQQMAHGALGTSGGVPDDLKDAATLVEAMRIVRSDFTVPVCRSIDNAARLLPSVDRLSTPRNVLMHLVWHWTYHSGHIGLMRLEWGSDYEWVMAPAPQS